MSDVPKEFQSKAAPLEADPILAAPRAASVPEQVPATNPVPAEAAGVGEGVKKILLEMQETGFSIQSTTPATNGVPATEPIKTGLKINKQAVTPLVPKG